MNAEPNCSLHEMAPVSFTARLAQVPKKIPNAVHICPIHAIESVIKPTQVYLGLSSRIIGTRHPMAEIMVLTMLYEWNLQHMTSPPRTEAGAFSAQKIGTVDALDPIPMPRRKRVMRSSHQVWVKAEPMTDRQQNMAEKKMVPRRPK